MYENYFLKNTWKIRIFFLKQSNGKNKEEEEEEEARTSTQILGFALFLSPQ